MVFYAFQLESTGVNNILFRGGHLCQGFPKTIPRFGDSLGGFVGLGI